MTSRAATRSEAFDTVPLVSIVVPVHNEAQNLDALITELRGVSAKCACDVEMIFVNDGSTDSSLEKLHLWRSQDGRIGIVNLSRGYGKESALTAGLAAAAGDAVIVMDADLQDPPACIPEMIHHWQQGFDVVAMKRSDRVSDGICKRTSAALFYFLISKLSDVNVPAQVGDFRLMSRKVVNAFLSLPESNRCLKVLFAWVGFRTTILEFERPSRFRGETKWTASRLLTLAMDALTAFSMAPLRVATAAGICTAAFSLFFGIYIVCKTLVFGEPVSGFPTLVALVTLLGGVQLLAIGVLGEYVGRTFMETKQRPLYLIEDVYPSTRGCSKELVQSSSANVHPLHPAHQQTRDSIENLEQMG